MGKRVIIQGDDILLLVAPACRTPAAAIVNETASQKTLSEQVIEFVYCFFFFPLPAQDLPFKAQDGVPDGRLRFQPCSGCFQHPKHTALASPRGNTTHQIQTADPINQELQRKAFAWNIRSLCCGKHSTCHL